jgi:hypothetical protein
MINATENMSFLMWKQEEAERATRSFYEVQGLYRGEWTKLFGPYRYPAIARNKMAELEKRNPACSYRWVRISGNITYV